MPLTSYCLEENLVHLMHHTTNHPIDLPNIFWQTNLHTSYLQHSSIAATQGIPRIRSIAHAYLSVEYTGARPTVLAPKAHQLTCRID